MKHELDINKTCIRKTGLRGQGGRRKEPRREKFYLWGQKKKLQESKLRTYNGPRGKKTTGVSKRSATQGLTQKKNQKVQTILPKNCVTFLIKEGPGCPGETGGNKNVLLNRINSTVGSKRP